MGQVGIRGLVIMKILSLSALDTRKIEIIERLQFIKGGSKDTRRSKEYRNHEDLV